MYGDDHYDYGNPEDYDDSSSSLYSESSSSLSSDEGNVLGLIHPVSEGKDMTHHKTAKKDTEFVTTAGKEYALLDWEEELSQPRKKLTPPKRPPPLPKQKKFLDE